MEDVIKVLKGPMVSEIATFIVRRDLAQTYPNGLATFSVFDHISCFC